MEHNTYIHGSQQNSAAPTPCAIDTAWQDIVRNGLTAVMSATYSCRQYRVHENLSKSAKSYLRTQVTQTWSVVEVVRGSALNVDSNYGHTHLLSSIMSMVFRRYPSVALATRVRAVENCVQARCAMGPHPRHMFDPSPSSRGHPPIIGKHHERQQHYRDLCTRHWSCIGTY